MSSDYQKLWLQPNQNRLAIGRAVQEIRRQGRALPCRVMQVNGAIVTVAFEMDTSPWTIEPVTIPKAESPWVRMATQVGDLGVTMPADVYLGGVSGLGGGTANFGMRGNLTSLVFVPCSNASSPPDDPDASQICGPNGAIIRTTSGTQSSIVTDTTGTKITFGTTTLEINASGITLTANGQTFSWGGTNATSTVPIQAPDFIVETIGSVKDHYHYVPAAPGNTDVMTG